MWSAALATDDIMSDSEDGCSVDFDDVFYSESGIKTFYARRFSVVSHIADPLLTSAE